MVLARLCDALLVLADMAQPVIAFRPEQPRVQILLVQLVDDVVAVYDRSLTVVQAGWMYVWSIE